MRAVIDTWAPAWVPGEIRHTPARPNFGRPPFIYKATYDVGQPNRPDRYSATGVFVTAFKRICSLKKQVDVFHYVKEFRTGNEKLIRCRSSKLTQHSRSTLDLPCRRLRWNVRLYGRPERTHRSRTQAP